MKCAVIKDGGGQCENDGVLQITSEFPDELKIIIKDFPTQKICHECLDDIVHPKTISIGFTVDENLQTIAHNDERDG